MINISNYTSIDNPLLALAGPARPEPPLRPTPPAMAAAAGRATAGSRLRRILASTSARLLSWLAADPRRLGGRLFVMNDAEAYWRGWQITRKHGGLGRSYRDQRFGMLAE